MEGGRGSASQVGCSKQPRNQLCEQLCDHPSFVHLEATQRHEGQSGAAGSICKMMHRAEVGISVPTWSSSFPLLCPGSSREHACPGTGHC